MKVIVYGSASETGDKASRHSSGKNLFQFADIVVDSCCLLYTSYRLPRMLSITGYVADSPIPTSTRPTAARANPGENIRKQKPMAVSARL